MFFKWVQKMVNRLSDHRQTTVSQYEYCHFPWMGCESIAGNRPPILTHHNDIPDVSSPNTKERVPVVVSVP